MGILAPNQKQAFYVEMSTDTDTIRYLLHTSLITSSLFKGDLSTRTRKAKLESGKKLMKWPPISPQGGSLPILLGYSQTCLATCNGITFKRVLSQGKVSGRSKVGPSLKKDLNKAAPEPWWTEGRWCSSTKTILLLLRQRLFCFQRECHGTNRWKGACISWLVGWDRI